MSLNRSKSALIVAFSVPPDLSANCRASPRSRLLFFRWGGAMSSGRHPASFFLLQVVRRFSDKTMVVVPVAPKSGFVFPKRQGFGVLS